MIEYENPRKMLSRIILLEPKKRPPYPSTYVMAQLQGLQLLLSVVNLLSI